MAQFTRRAIIESTVAMVTKKPLNRITVRDIVEDCGITRNTFYYYFKDIYDVLDAAVQAEIDKYTAVAPEEREEALFALIAYFSSYKRAWLNLYKMLGHEKMSAYVTRHLHGIILDYIHTVPGAEQLSDMDRRILCDFYEEALFGVMARWIRDEHAIRAPEEVRAIVQRIRRIFDGQVELAVSNCLQEETEATQP